MKKSNKTKINEKDLMKDTTKIMKIISDLEKANLETIDLKKFEEEVNSIEKNLRKKYKDILPENLEEESEKYLDPEEVLEDANKLIKIINDIDNIDMNNIDSLEEELKSFEKTLSDKYKDQLEEEDTDDLDTKE